MKDAEAMKRRAQELVDADRWTAEEMLDSFAILRAVAAGEVKHVMEDDRNTLVIWTDLPEGTPVLVLSPDGVGNG